MPRKPDVNAKKRAFLAAFGVTCSIKAAAAAAKVTREDHHGWLKDPVYRAAWETRQDEAAQALEDEAVRRAYEGVKRVLYYKGKPIRTGRGRNARIAYETQYDSQLLITLLKRFRPNLYRERTETQVTGSVEIIDRLQSARKRLIEMQRNEPAAG